MTSSSSDPKPRRRIWRWLAYAAIAVVVVVLVAGFFVGRYLRAAVDADLLEQLVNDALVEATGGLYTVTLESIEWRRGGLSLRLEGLSLMLDREVLAAQDADGSVPSLLFQLQHATVDISGVDPWALLRGQGVRALSLTIDQPLIQLSGLEEILSPPGARIDAAPAPNPPPAAARPASPPAAERGPAPKLRIWRVAVNGAALESYRRNDLETEIVEETFTLFERFDGVDIAIDDLDLSRLDGEGPDRLLFADDIRLDIAQYYYSWPPGRHAERHGPISVSTGAGTIRIANYTLKPAFERRDEVGEDGAAPPRYDLEIDEVRVEGLDVRGILNGEGFAASDFVLEGVRGRMVSDPPADSGDAPMAQEAGAVGSVTTPITEVRPGALLTEVLSGLPEIAVERLHVSDVNFEIHVDREGEEFLAEPVLQHSVENLNLDLTDYRTTPDAAYDPTRPFFSEASTATASRFVITGTKRRYRIEMDDWTMTDNPGRARVEELKVVPLFDRRELADRIGERVEHYEATARGIVLEQIDFGSLIDDVDVVVGSIRLESAVVRGVGDRIWSPGAERPPGRAQPVAPAEALAQVVLGLPNIRIDSLDLQDIDYESWTDYDDGWLEEPRRDLLLSGFDFHLDEVLHSELEGYDLARPLLAESAEIRLEELRLELPDRYQQLVVHDVVVSSDQAQGVIGDLAIDAFDPDPQLLARRVGAATVPRIQTGEIRLDGTPIGDFIRTGEVRLAGVELTEPRISVLATAPPSAESDRPDAGAAGAGNTETLLDVVRSLPVIRVGSVAIRDAHYARHVGLADHDWSEWPDPLESVTGLTLTLERLDTDPALDPGRLLFSDIARLEVQDLLLSLNDGSNSVGLSGLRLSSNSDTLVIAGARYSTRAEGGNNDFTVGRIELANVPYGRTFKALVEPPTTELPVLSAMIDKGTELRIDGVEADLDDSRRALTIGTIEGAVQTGVLRIAGVDLRPTLPDADPSTPVTEYREEQTLLSMQDLRLSGVDFARFAAEGVFEAERFQVDAPSVVLVTGVDVSERPTADAPEPTGGRVLADVIADGVDGLPPIVIDSIRLNDIEFEERRSLEGRPVRDFERIQLAIDGLDLHADRDPTAPESVLYANDIRVDVPRQRTWIDNVGYEIDVGPISISTGSGTVALGSVEYIPPSTVEQYLTRTRVIESDRIEVRAGQVGLSGLDFGRLLREEGIYAEGMRIADWSVDVIHDKKKPDNPRKGPNVYPHEAVQRMGLKFGIGRVELAGGAVRYGERDPNGDRPGEIWWDRLAGTITNLSNDPARSSMETPTVLQIEARFLDQPYLRLTWNLPLLEPGPTMSFSAELGPFEVTRLSSILAPLEGVRVTSGVFDQTWFDIDIRDGRGTGTFNALYHDVKIQLEDRNTGGRNLGQRLLSFAANVILPSNNRNDKGEPDRVGTVNYEVDPEAPFFKVLWDSIKSGMLDVAR